jgi:hypothetical protein
MSRWCSVTYSPMVSGCVHGCARHGAYRDTVVRCVSDVPVVGHPLRLRVRVPLYRCTMSDCSREVFAHNTDRPAGPGWSTTRRCARYVVRRLMIDHMTVSAMARELGLCWDTINAIALMPLRWSWRPTCAAGVPGPLWRRQWMEIAGGPHLDVGTMKAYL